MGNFSRDTFDPLKRYVSVRLQQGVPLLDADWNEMDDIRRSELRTFIKWFIGDGIPANSDGSRNDAFRIAAMPTPDSENFRILVGSSSGDSGASRCLVDGVEVFITQDIEFKSQPLHENYADPNPSVAPDATPVDPSAPKIASIPTTAGSYLVYLDVWEWEVGSSVDQSQLVNASLGIETCVRFKRSWAVRVFKAGEENRLPKHSYYLSATINRPTDDAVITPEQITDQRRTDINLSKYLKSPVHVELGSTVIDNQALITLFSQLRSALSNRLETQSLFVNTAPTELDRTLVYFELQGIFQVCMTGIVQVRTNNIGNADATQVLLTLAEVQKTFLTTLELHGDPPEAGKNNFIAEYRRRLGLLNDNTNANDLINAYLTQQDIIDWLSTGSEASRFVSANWDSLLNTAVSNLARAKPNLFQPGGSLYGPRDLEEFLRNFTSFFQYPLVSSIQQNSAKPMDLVFPNVREILSQLGTSSIYVRTLIEMRKAVAASSGLSNTAKTLAAPFFDYAIGFFGGG